MKKINWRRISVAFTTLLTFISGISYSVGNVQGVDIATIIPPKLKGWLFLAGAISTFILHAWLGISPQQ